MDDEANRVQDDILTKRGLKKRKVLLVGGAGYVGVPVAQYLLAKGYDVLNIDRNIYGHHMAVSGLLMIPGYTYKNVDFADFRNVEELLGDVTDVVVLGGLVGDPITKKYPDESHAINDVGVSNVLKGLDGQGMNKVLFISTCSNYGEIPEDQIADEDYALKPLSLYAKSKVMQEQVLLQNDFDYTASILRFSTAFGLSPRMRFDLTVNEFTRAMFLGENMEVYDADTWRPYCHTFDFGRAIARALEAPRDNIHKIPFNVGGDNNNFTKQMVVDQICKQLPDAKYSIVEGGFDRRNYRVNFSRIKDVLYFTPHYDVGQGIAQLIYALQQGLFSDHDQNPNFYNNRVVSYP